MISRIFNGRAAAMFASATLSAVLLSACEPNQPAQQAAQPSPVATEAAPTQPAVVAPALKELDAATRKAKMAQSRLCNIETVDGVKPTADAAVPADMSSVVFSGWIGDEATGKRPENPRLLVQTLNRMRAWEQPVGDIVIRKDVGKAVNIPTFENGGFKTSLDLTQLPPGEYRVMLVYGTGEQYFVCDNGRRLLR